MGWDGVERRTKERGGNLKKERRNQQAIVQPPMPAPFNATATATVVTAPRRNRKGVK